MVEKILAFRLGNQEDLSLLLLSVLNQLVAMFQIYHRNNRVGKREFAMIHRLELRPNILFEARAMAAPVGVDQNDSYWSCL
jgi:hypothetical protein